MLGVLRESHLTDEPTSSGKNQAQGLWSAQVPLKVVVSTREGPWEPSQEKWAEAGLLAPPPGSPPTFPEGSSRRLRRSWALTAAPSLRREEGKGRLGVRLPRAFLFLPQHHTDLASQAPGQEPSGDHPPSSPKRPVGASEDDAPQCTSDLAKQGQNDWGPPVRTVAETSFPE